MRRGAGAGSARPRAHEVPDHAPAPPPQPAHLVADRALAAQLLLARGHGRSHRWRRLPAVSGPPDGPVSRGAMIGRPRAPSRAPKPDPPHDLGSRRASSRTASIPTSPPPSRPPSAACAARAAARRHDPDRGRRRSRSSRTRSPRARSTSPRASSSGRTAASTRSRAGHEDNAVLGALLRLDDPASCTTARAA